MRTRAWLATVPVLLLTVGACGGDDDGDGGGGLSMGSLSDAGDTCPVDLGAAVVDAGMTDDAGDVAVEVTEGSGDGGQDDSAIDQFGGTHVECTVAVDDGEATAIVFATERPSAVNLLLPQMSADLGLASDVLLDVAERAEDAETGELLDLGADGPAAAAPIEVGDAESAVLYVSAPDATPEQVRSAAEAMLDTL